MLDRTWSQLPDFMRTPEVKKYYKHLSKHRSELVAKRIMDVSVASVMLVLLSPVMAGIAVAIKLDSAGPVFFRQERVTQYGRRFKIFKFRTMVKDAPKLGAQVTSCNDARITRIGAKIRKYRIDELPQLINVVLGDMTFVGTRPEVVKYVKAYSPEMMATLLLPAGITSRASIEYKDEEKLINASTDVDKTYIEEVLPGKMQYNLDSLMKYSFIDDIKVMIETVFAVLK